MPLKRSALKPKPSWKPLQRKRPMRRKSRKRIREEKKYAKLRVEYMSLHPLCERCLKNGNDVMAKELHHKMGRGIYYLDVRFFASLCSECHGFCKEASMIDRMKSEGWLMDRIGNATFPHSNL